MKLQLKSHLFLKNNIVPLILLLTTSACIKKVDSDNSSYFLRGVIINGYAPVFDLYKCNYQGEVRLGYNSYELEIYPSSSGSEAMVNGNFIFTKGKAGETYKIRWRLAGSSEWHETQEKLPNPDTSLINKSKIENDNTNIFINNINSSSDDVFILSYFNEKNKNKFNSFASYFSPLSPNISTAQYTRPNIEDRSKYIQLYQINNKLILWPPRTIENPFWENFSPCLKPFNVTAPNGLKYEDFYLFLINKNDVTTYRNLFLNDINSEGPLFIGDPINFDYQNKNQYAQILTLFKFDDVQLKHGLNFSDTTSFELRYNGLPLDTNLIKIENVSLQLKDVNINVNAMDPKSQSGYYFHRDLIASKYNLDHGPCGIYQNEYLFRPVVRYSLRSVGKSLYFLGDYVKYENKPFHYIIDIN